MKEKIGRLIGSLLGYTLIWAISMCVVRLICLLLAAPFSLGVATAVWILALIFRSLVNLVKWIVGEMAR